MENKNGTTVKKLRIDSFIFNMALLLKWEVDILKDTGLIVFIAK